MKDVRGVELEAGQIVAYFKSIPYACVYVARIAEVRKRVKLIAADGMGSKFPYVASESYSWVEASNLLVVESLPRAEGRLNTDNYWTKRDGNDVTEQEQEGP